MVIGASPNPGRYSYRAVRSLVAHSVPVIAVGLREGTIEGIEIQKPFPEVDGIDTITMYVGPLNQKFYYDFILKTSPERVIFNPGTENDELERKLRSAGIKVVYGCTLIMLANDEY